MNHKSLRCSHPLQEVDGLGDTALMNDVAEIYQQVRCLKDLQDIGVSPSLASTRFRSGDYTKIMGVDATIHIKGEDKIEFRHNVVELLEPVEHNGMFVLLCLLVMMMW